MKRWKIILLALLGLLLLIQLIPVDRTNPESAPEDDIATAILMPENVHNILKRACYDCHSNQTEWPWYSKVAPVKFFVAHHVEEGREFLNFSEWTSYEPHKANHKLEEVIEEVAEGEMPLRGYVVWHPEALISPDDTALLFSWIRQQIKGKEYRPEDGEHHKDMKENEDDDDDEPGLTAGNLRLEELPTQVWDSLQLNFPGAAFLEANSVLQADSILQYRINIDYQGDKTALNFSPNGEFLGQALN